MRKAAYFSVGIFLFSLAVLSGLLFFTNNPNRYANGFVRKFLKSSLTKFASKRFPYSLNGITGVTDSNLYLSVFNQPWRLVTTDYNLVEKQEDTVMTAKKDSIANLFSVSVDFPHIYIFSPNLPGIIIHDLKIKKDSLVRTPSFIRGVSIGPGRFVLRAQNQQKTDFQFSKITIGDKIYLSNEKNITDQQNDGGYSTDGLLYFDRQTKRLCYTFFYQNGFLCLDTNLHLLYHAKTLDTIRQVKVSGKVFKNSKSLSAMLTGPAVMISYEGCVDGGHLFLQSMLQADNENEKDFDANLVIDIFNLISGVYEGSFYLPVHNKKAVNTFCIYKKWLIALDNSEVNVYRFRF